MVRLTNEQGRWVLDALRGAKPGTAKQLADTIEMQLNSPHHDQDLIETIAEIIATPTARLVLGGALLTNLREAVLSPRELARVRALQHTWQSCCRCGGKISDREITSMSGQQVYCANCLTPTLHTCPKCKQVHPLPGIDRLVKKHTVACAVCAAGGIAEPVEEEGGFDDREDVIAVNPNRHRIEERLFRPRGAGLPPVVRVPPGGWTDTPPVGGWVGQVPERRFAAGVHRVADEAVARVDARAEAALIGMADNAAIGMVTATTNFTLTDERPVFGEPNIVAWEETT